MKVHTQEIDPICRHDPEHKYWHTKDRGDVAVCQMTVEHINNCIKMIKRQIPLAGHISYYTPEDAPLARQEVEHLEDQIDMLQGELQRRLRIKFPYRLGV